YQYASRWLLMEPWLEQYAERAHRDIRGYYFLQQEDDLAGKLRNWNKLDAATRDRLFPLLINLCGNSEKTATECEEELVLETDSRGSAYDFYQNHLLTGQEIYASYFRLQNPRPEAVFTKDNPNQFILPFLKPANERV